MPLLTPSLSWPDSRRLESSYHTTPILPSGRDWPTSVASACSWRRAQQVGTPTGGVRGPKSPIGHHSSNPHQDSTESHPAVPTAALWGMASQGKEGKEQGSRSPVLWLPAGWVWTGTYSPKPQSPPWWSELNECGVWGSSCSAIVLCLLPSFWLPHCEPSVQDRGAHGRLWSVLGSWEDSDKRTASAYSTKKHPSCAQPEDPQSTTRTRVPAILRMPLFPGRELGWASPGLRLCSPCHLESTTVAHMHSHANSCGIIN